MPSEGLVLRCERDGLATALENRLLGGYDGASAWSLILGNTRPGDEQLMVETHEGLHHELQSSTGFGRLAAMALLLARRGFRPYALTELFHDMVDSSRSAHEVYATTISASVVGVSRARTLLAGNTAYLAHLTRGHALAGDHVLAWRVRESAAAATIRACMAPERLFDLLAAGFGQIGRASLENTDRPDVRLAAFEAEGGAATWARFLEELADEFPDNGLREGDPDRREVPDDDAGVSELRAFEEDILLRRCYEHVSRILDTTGMPTVSWDQQVQHAHELKNAVAEVDQELSRLLNVVAERRPIVDDALEYDRQGIVLRNRLPARVADEAITTSSLRAFWSWNAASDPHVCGIWLRRKVAEKQFAFPPGTELPEILVALVVPMQFPTTGETLVFGLLPAHSTPRQVQELLGEVPLLVLTTHYTLASDAAMVLLRTAEPVFVVMDLPVAWHVEDWLRQDAKVRMAALPLDGVQDGDLMMVAFDVDRAPGFRFLHVGGTTGVSLLIERLRRVHGDRLTISGDVVRTDAAAVNMALGHVLGAWHVLDQDGVE